MKRKWIASLCLIAFLPGCATIYGRQNDMENVFFESNVEEVEVICSGESVRTPGNLKLRQSRDHNCKALKEGYESRYFRISSSTSREGFRYSTRINTAKWGWWTLGIGTLTGWAVDFVSGAMRDLNQDRYYLQLQPRGSTGTAKRLLERTVDVGETIVAMPKNLVDNTAETVLNSTVRAGSQPLGLGDPEARRETEQILEGEKEAERLETLREEEGPASPLPEVEG